MFNGLFHIREPNNEPILKGTFLPPTNYRYPFMVEP